MRPFILVLLTLFFLSGTLFFDYRNIDDLSAHLEWVAHTHEVLVNLKTVQLALTDAETGVRGYVITGEDAYLEPYNNALKTIDQDVARLKAATADNEVQQKNIAVLTQQIKEKLGRLRETLEVRRTYGFDGMKARIKSGIGKKMMDDARGTIAKMEAEEKRLLESRAQTANSTIIKARSVAFIETGIGVFLLTIAMVMFQRHTLERNRREHDVNAQKEWFRVTLTSIGDAVITTDTKCRVTFMNTVAEALTGHKTADAMGKHIDEVFLIVNENTRLKAENPIHKVLETGKIRGLANHTALISKGGTEFPIDDSAAPIYDINNKLMGVVLVFRDITERHTYETTLRDSVKTAQNATRAKDEFLAIVSHELRTPLTAMLGWVRMIQNRNLEPKLVTKGLAVIERNINVQTQLIEDLLDISRIIAGKMNLSIHPTNLERVVTAAIESVRPSADAKNIAIDVDLRPIWISADADRLQQIVWNLLANAIKFTEKGGKVSARIEQTSSHARVIVTDNGKGIDREFLPHLFDRFSQQDASITRVHGGLGLGLSIVKHLVEAHGGTVHADSGGIGKGTTLTVVLPIPVALTAVPEGGKTPVPSEAEISLKGIRVLVVDDEADARDLLQEIITQYGGIITASASSSHALTILEVFKPDILVSDIGMPGMDGYEFIQKIRNNEDSTLKGIPAIALTAYARNDDRRRAIEAGFQAHEPKPIEPNRLVMLIAQLAKSVQR